VEAAGTAGCLDLAHGPWTKVTYSVDPLTQIRSGIAPQVPGTNGDGGFDRTIEFPEINAYRDSSTLNDPEALRRAWLADGYREGVAADHHRGGHEYSIIAVRFRDPAAAVDALEAHLADYCQRAVNTRRLQSGNGLVVRRDKGAVRSLSVVGDVELSLFVCVCYGRDDADRENLVEGWTQITELVEASHPPV